MITTSLNQNSKTIQDVPQQLCSFPRTSQYEIQGHFQDKGSFLELFLGKSWTNLLLLCKNKFLLIYVNALTVTFILLGIFVCPPKIKYYWMTSHSQQD